MNLSDFRGVIVGLDQAYEQVEAEIAALPGPRVQDPSAGFFFRGPRPRAAGIQAGGGCEVHAGAVHALPNDALANALGQELGGWLSLARSSETARGLLGIDRISDDGREARVGTMTSFPFRRGSGGLLEPAARDHDFELLMSASRDVVVPGRSGGPWAPGGPAAGSGVEPCPPPKLLGVFSDSEITRVPLGYSETWLSSGPRDGQWSEACESCKSGLSGWACGHDEARAKLPPEVHARYAQRTAEWEDFLRGEGAAQRKKSAQRTRSQVPVPAAATPSAGSDSGAVAEERGAGPGAPEAPAKRAAGGGSGLPAGGVRPDVGFSPRHAGAATGVDAATDEGRLLPDAGEPGVPGAPALSAIGAAASAIVQGASGVSARRAAAGTAAITAAAGTPAAITAAGTPAAIAGAAAAPAAIAGAAAAPAIAPKRVVAERERWEARPRRAGEALADALLGAGDQVELAHVHIRLESSEFSCEHVQVRELSGKEAISRLFGFEVLIVFPEETELPVDVLVGASISIVFERGGLPARSIHGMVAEVCDRLETESTWRSYRLWIAPRLWRASLVVTQEVHVDISVPDLIRKKLALVGLDSDEDVEMRLRGTYPRRELIVQYKETDVAFISRLAEHLGICFFFEHESGRDKLVFSDENAGFRPISREQISFRPRGEKVDIFELEARSRAFPANFVMQDYNYRLPTVDLTSTYDQPSGLGGGVVEYGAHYKSPSEGADLARVRAEEQVAEHKYWTGRSDAAELVTGGRFRLVDHPRLASLDLAVVELEHHALQSVLMQGGGTEPYRNVFRVVDTGQTFRPRRATPRPRIHGVLTALVEPDPSGVVAELAQIDTEGRYTVLFYFDASDVSGKSKHSHPVRMIQPHAGPHYGIHFPLKPGVEVLIVFMDGDPDRPLIVGSVPNPITPSPVVEHVNLMNRIETASGLIIEMRDAVPPLVR